MQQMWAKSGCARAGAALRLSKAHSSRLWRGYVWCLTQWVYAARARLIPNVHINGLSLSDYAKQSAGTSSALMAAMEPFDEGLSQRVHTLSSQVDETTERVVACRKNLPLAYARAIQRRAEARNALAEAKEEQRQRRLRKTRTRSPFPALARGQPLPSTFAQLTPVDVAAKARSEATLEAVYAALEHLQTVCMDEKLTMRIC